MIYTKFDKIFKLDIGSNQENAYRSGRIFILNWI
jgi:hypothetical protein